MEIKLQPFQDEFLFSTKKFPCLCSGVGSGKTFMLLLKGWKQCEDYPGAVVLIVRKEFTDLHDSTLKDFQRYFSVNVNSSKEYKFPNGSVMMFRHGAELDVLKNMSLSFVGVEQAEEFDNEEQFTYLRDRLRHPIGTRQLAMICNANGHNYIWRLWKNRPPSEEYHLITATSFDNAVNLPDDFIADLRKMEGESPNHYKRFVLNSFEELGADDLLLTGAMVYESPKLDFAKEGTIRKILAVDVARFGEDETVFTIIQSQNIRQWHQIYQYTWRDKPLTEVVGKTLDLCREFQPDIIVIDDVGMGCLVKGTEIWAKKGWVKVEDVKTGDEIYSKDNNGFLCVEKVVSNVLREKTRVIDNGEYAFSFSHFLPIKTRREYKYILKSWDDIAVKESMWLDNSFKWEGKDIDFALVKQDIAMPNGGIKNVRGVQTIKCKDFVKFLAWFISEGSGDKRSVVLSQSANSTHNKDIANTLRACGFHYNISVYNGEYNYRVSNNPLRKWLEDNCYAAGKKSALTKKVPQYIKNLTPKMIRLFLDEFIKGDGFLHKGQNTYCTLSTILADDLLELIYKTEKYGGKRVKYLKGSIGYINNRKITRTSDHYTVWENKNGAMTIYPKGLSERLENVYDVKITGKTRLFMVRFGDNRAFWVHNGGVTDRLSEQRKVPEAFVGNEKSSNVLYNNKRSEGFFRLKEFFEQGNLRIMNDPMLMEQLLSLRYKYNSNNVKSIVTKDEMRKDGLKSPDRADALMMAMYYTDRVFREGIRPNLPREAEMA